VDGLECKAESNLSFTPVYHGELQYLLPMKENAIGRGDMPLLNEASMAGVRVD